MPETALPVRPFGSVHRHDDARPASGPMISDGWCPASGTPWRAHQDGINRLNVYPVPDGDTGTNMVLTMESVVAELDGVALDLASTCKAIGHGSLMALAATVTVLQPAFISKVESNIKQDLRLKFLETRGTILLSAPASIQFGSHQLRGGGPTDKELRELTIPDSY